MKRKGALALLPLLLIFFVFSKLSHANEVASDEQRRAIGERAANALLSTLKNALMAAMSSGGPKEAVRVCASDAMSLAQRAEQSLPEGVGLARISERFRNPANAPSEFDRQILQELEGELKGAKEGELPTILRFDPARNTHVYYKTILTAPMCLTCHGAKESIPPEVRSLLERQYPQDRAFGFKAGEFRGAVRVVLPAH